MPQIKGLGEINTIVLDLNGTLSVKGKIVEGAKERMEALNKKGFKIILFTGDQRGSAQTMCDELGIEFKKAKSSEEKEAFFLEQNPEQTAAIGNARIDIGKFKHSKLSIATLQGEGIHTAILNHVDIIVPSINDALDLFLDVNSLEATLKV